MRIGQISIVRDGQNVTVVSPYSESNNSEFRARGGRYSKESGWTFAASPATDKMLDELFGFDGVTGEAVTAIVPESAIDTRYAGAPWQLDGYVLASRRGRDSRVETPDGVQLFEGRWASSGGSMKSPRVTSSETVTLHVVMPKALAERHSLALVGEVPAAVPAVVMPAQQPNDMIPVRLDPATRKQLGEIAAVSGKPVQEAMDAFVNACIHRAGPGILTEHGKTA